ncbi:DUF3392 family protein [Ferrimonas gelatinilytica]|uniref:DUF3392 domain-containing protein n=1 Tax=Ferrimonas gelatinilytica TaxID=1255257 RepID=A0ABP9S800_9GAMM
MSWLHELVTSLGRTLYPYLFDISIALMVCLLVVVAPWLQGQLRRRIRQWPFLLRTLVFVLLVTLGYGLLITQSAPWLAKQLAQLSAGWLLLVVTLAFVAIGLAAERARQM